MIIRNFLLDSIERYYTKPSLKRKSNKRKSGNKRFLINLDLNHLLKFLWFLKKKIIMTINLYFKTKAKSTKNSSRKSISQSWALPNTEKNIWSQNLEKSKIRYSSKSNQINNKYQRKTNEAPKILKITYGA